MTNSRAMLTIATLLMAVAINLIINQILKLDQEIKELKLHLAVEMNAQDNLQKEQEPETAEIKE